MYRRGDVEAPSDGLPSLSAFDAAAALPGTREQVHSSGPLERGAAGI
jgi:hypothetical protein